jgi:hypothetical protein
VDPLIGQRFAGRYRIRALVAAGSMGKVYDAEQEPLGRAVALKVLDIADADRDASASRGQRAQERFLREASLLGRLSHPNTVRVFDYGVEQDKPFIVMELVRGQNLRQLLKGRISPIRAVRIARQICGSLSEAHEVGLVHRDLKPANVLVARGPDGDDLVKVVDFGLVKEMEDAVHMTGEGLMVGTPMFMAPEQIRGRKLDQRVDVYSLGILLYNALTGSFPFEQGQPAAVLMAHLTDPPKPFSEVAPGLELPDCVEWTVQRCLEKSPSGRFANVRELSRALKLCEAALLDEATATLTRLSLVEGRLVLPEAIYGRTPLPARVRQMRMARNGLAAIVVLSLCCVLAAAFGFVVLKGISAATRVERAPVVITPPVAPAVPATTRPEPEPEPQPEPAVGEDAEGEAEPEPEPRVEARPPPRPAPTRERPARKPPVAVAKPAPAPEPPPAPAPPEPAPTAADSELEVRSSDLVDPWAD